MLPGPARFHLPILLALLGLIGTVPAAFPSSAVPDPEGEQERIASRIESARRQIWWNSDEIVKALELSPEQRAAMDDALGDMLRKVLARELESEMLRERAVLQEALDQRRWDTARGAAQRLEELRGYPARRHLELKVEAFSILTDGQWETLRADLGHLLVQPWVRLGRIGSVRPPRRVGGPRVPD